MYVSELFFLWQTQIQMIEYGLNDTKRIKKKQVTYIDTFLIYNYTVAPSDMNFQTFLLRKVIFAKKNS